MYTVIEVDMQTIKYDIVLCRYYLNVNKVEVQSFNLLPAMRLSSSWALCLISSPLAYSSAIKQAIKIQAPGDVPAGASNLVPHDFASLSFPIHFFADYTGRLYYLHTRMTS